MRLPFRPGMAFLAFIAALAPLRGRAAPNDVVMLGPMFHYNFAWGHEGIWSLGLEGSYWHEPIFPWGMDVGIEYDLRGRTRLYTEAEAGFVFAGGALGPCLEFGGGRIRVGLQGSAWANALIGADIRARAFWGGGPELAPGYYFKLPIVHSDWKSDL